LGVEKVALDEPHLTPSEAPPFDPDAVDPASLTAADLIGGLSDIEALAAADAAFAKGSRRWLYAGLIAAVIFGLLLLRRRAAAAPASLQGG
jgi:hypothetical protein